MCTPLVVLYNRIGWNPKTYPEILMVFIIEHENSFLILI